MSCKAIRSRILPSNDNILRPLKHGIAFARIVYKDYEFIEKQVQVSFHPQNAFCFVIDINASEEFKKRMRALAACMPNVIVLAGENFELRNCKAISIQTRILSTLLVTMSTWFTTNVSKPYSTYLAGTTLCYFKITIL